MSPCGCRGQVGDTGGEALPLRGTRTSGAPGVFPRVLGTRSACGGSVNQHTAGPCVLYVLVTTGREIESRCAIVTSLAKTKPDRQTESGRPLGRARGTLHPFIQRTFGVTGGIATHVTQGPVMQPQDVLISQRNVCTCDPGCLNEAHVKLLTMVRCQPPPSLKCRL